MKHFKVTYRLPKGDDGYQQTIIQAPSYHMAERIFKQMFPTFRYVSAVEVC